MQIEIDTTDLKHTLEQLYDRKLKLIAYASADGLDTLVLEGHEEDLFTLYFECFNPFNEWTSADVVRSEFHAHVLTK
tara:strand:+ start:1063 stop:1293 length:231 start_codon:yes stop_codon:yes gene_type:complete